MSERDEIHVTDTAWHWLSIYAEAYVSTDYAFLRLSAQLDTASQPQRNAIADTLKGLAEQRRAAYRSLVEAVTECETQRLTALAVQDRNR